MLYRYDLGTLGVGRLSLVTMPFGTVAYAYNAQGLVIGEQRAFALADLSNTGSSGPSDTQMVTRAYNALGQPTLHSWHDGQQWRIHYDERGLAYSVEWFDSKANSWQVVAGYGRGVAGLPRSRISAYAQVRSYLYDMFGRVAQDTVTVKGVEIAKRSYGFYDAGDLERVQGHTQGVSANASFTYDAHHRVLTAVGPGNYVGDFTYSPAGNVQTAKVNGIVETRHVQYQYGGEEAQAVTRLTSLTTGKAYADFGYDRAGNMTSRTTPQGTQQFYRDATERIRLAAGPNGLELYYYDYAGNRMLAVSQAEGIRFWFGERESHYTLAGQPVRNYLHLNDGGSTVARVETANGSGSAGIVMLELQYADALRNLMVAIDRDGSVIANFLYGAFGEVVHNGGDKNHRRQFNGKEHDRSTGLRYYGFRYYDALTLRWSSADSLYRYIPEVELSEPQRMNLYSFSLNNPLVYYDPDGRDPASYIKSIFQVYEAKEFVEDMQAIIDGYNSGLAGEMPEQHSAEAAIEVLANPTEASEMVYFRAFQTLGRMHAQDLRMQQMQRLVAERSAEAGRQRAQATVQKWETGLRRSIVRASTLVSGKLWR